MVSMVVWRSSIHVYSPADIRAHVRVSIDDTVAMVIQRSSMDDPYGYIAQQTPMSEYPCMAQLQWLLRCHDHLWMLYVYSRAVELSDI